MKQVARLIKKDGTELVGYWNSKKYAGYIYFNVSETGLHADINFKKSVKLNIKTEVKSLKWEDEKTESTISNDKITVKSTSSRLPKTTAAWMYEMRNE